MLTELSKIYSLYMLNEQIGRDRKIGNFTFVSTLGYSVFDYSLCSGDLLCTFTTLWLMNIVNLNIFLY